MVYKRVRGWTSRQSPICPLPSPVHFLLRLGVASGPVQFSHPEKGATASLQRYYHQQTTHATPPPPRALGGLKK